MGCGCRGGGNTGRPRTPTETKPGEWVVVYPSGRETVLRGPRARQLAQREAIATGGKAYQG